MDARTTPFVSMSGPPRQQGMANLDPTTFASWGAENVASYFTAKGYGEYASLWVEHKITGERAVLLTPRDIEQMGVRLIGDRLGIQKELRILKSAARQGRRNQVIAQYRQAYDGSCIEQAFVASLCKCCLPWEPDLYTLSSSTLKVRSYHVERCCGKRCWCMGGQWETDSINLDRIVDIDTAVSVKGCACCADRKCLIEVAALAGTHAESEESRTVTTSLLLDAASGESFAQQIRDQIEEYKVILADNDDKA